MAIITSKSTQRTARLKSFTQNYNFLITRQGWFSRIICTCVSYTLMPNSGGNYSFPLSMYSIKECAFYIGELYLIS